MLHPEGERGVDAILHLEQGHEIILGHLHPFAARTAYGAERLAGRYGAALHHIEGVGERLVAAEALHKAFEGHPVALVERRKLWRHVRHVEGVVVGRGRVESVGRGAEVAAVVVSAEAARANLVGGAEVGVVGKGLLGARYVFGTCVAVEAEGYPAAVECLFVELEAVSHDVAAAFEGAVREYDGAAVGLGGRRFHACRHLLGCGGAAALAA